MIGQHFGRGKIDTNAIFLKDAAWTTGISRKTAGHEPLRNTAAAGKDLYCGGLGGGPPPVLLNCIIRDTAGSYRCEGTLAGNFIDTDPLFDDPGLYDFGRTRKIPVGDGETPVEMPDFLVEPPYLYLKPDSPAIDGGAAGGAPETDMNGVPRPCGAGVDFGAFESCPPARFLRGDSNADGRLDIADPVWTLNGLFCSGPAAPCPDAADPNDDGEVDVSDALHGITYQLLGGPPPPAPFPGCGLDATPDAIGCPEHAPCAAE